MSISCATSADVLAHAFFSRGEAAARFFTSVSRSAPYAALSRGVSISSRRHGIHPYGRQFECARAGVRVSTAASMAVNMAAPTRWPDDRLPEVQVIDPCASARRDLAYHVHHLKAAFVHDATQRGHIALHNPPLPRLPAEITT